VSTRRPALDQLWAAARRRDSDGVVVRRFDRFSRPVSDLVRSLEEFRALGVAFVSIHEQIDTNSPTGRVVFAVVAIARPDLDAVWEAKLRERLVRLYSPVVPGQPRKPPVVGWVGPGTDKIDSTKVRSGSHALHFTISKKPGLADVGGADTIELPRGKELESSAWAVTDGTDTLDDKFVIGVYDAQGKLLVIKEFPQRRDFPIWTRFVEKPPMSDAAFKAKVQILIASTKGSLWLDDFSLKVDGKEVLKNGGFEDK
jgi:hypothetical protein